MTYDDLIESILTAQEMMLQHDIEANSLTLNGRKYGKLIENLPPNIKPTIFGMAVKAEYALPDDYDFLVQYEPPRLKSNADRIRAMSAEELAELLASTDGDFPPNCEGVPVRKLEAYWLAWLRQEADNG